MDENLPWEKVYRRWQYCNISFNYPINAQLPIKKIYVKYEQEGVFYGYDWLLNSDTKKREQLIENNPIEFIYFTKGSNRGTIQTAEMLALSETEEERAAIWIAATTFEIMQHHYSELLDNLNLVALHFLRDKYYVWHHAMRKLVPDVIIPYNIFENCNLNDLDVVMSLIQMNTLMLSSNYSIFLYSSLENEDFKEYRSVRKKD